MALRQSALLHPSDTRAAALYPLLAAAGLFALIQFILAPVDLAFAERLAITVLAITVEALPFLLVGSILSAVIHLYVSDDLIARIIPRNAVLGVCMASVMGLGMPVCDCGTVPIVRRMVAKGVPLHVAITFMLAVPMINPLVIFSTWFAFYQFPNYIFYRLGLGLAAAIAIGLIMSFFDGKKQLRVLEYLQGARTAGEHEHHHHDHDHDHHHEPARGILGHLRAVALHANDDFFDIGRYFLVGVLLSSLVESVIPQNGLSVIGHEPLLSVLVMVAAAYVLSVCSQADAFLARTFMNQFSIGALVAFMIFSPMVDLKNTLMLSTAFKKRFILLLIGLIAAVSILFGYVLNLRSGL